MTDTEPNFQVLIIHSLGNYRIIRWNFVSKEMSLLFNMLSRLVIAFLPRSKRVLITWLQSPFAVTLEPPKRKSLTVSKKNSYPMSGFNTELPIEYYPHSGFFFLSYHFRVPSKPTNDYS